MSNYIYPVHELPHHSCPIHVPFEQNRGLLDLPPCFPKPNLARQLPHRSVYIDLPPPPRSALSKIREPERVAIPARREKVKREAIIIEKEYHSSSKPAKRHVRFDLPTRFKKWHSQKDQNDLDDAELRHGHVPLSIKHPHLSPQTPPRPMRSILTKPPPPLPPRRLPLAPDTPTQPTVYMITYSTDLTPTLKSATKLLKTHLPARSPPIPHLYTIDATSFHVPPSPLCAMYSGLHPTIQTWVMRDPRARKAVRRGVRDLLDFGARDRRRGGHGEMEVAMSVCCTVGTHRSVAIADVIAREVRGEVRRWGSEEGVRIVVRHVHRVQKRGDEF